MLSERIIQLRRRLGWSQEELAARLDVSRQSVSKWESGASQPELDKVVAMSRVFGVSTDYLLKDEPDGPEPAPEAPCAAVPAQSGRAGGSALSDTEPDAADEGPRTGHARPRLNDRGERILTIAEANKYLENRRQCARGIGLGAGMCVACAAPLMVMIGMAQRTRWLSGLFVGMGLMLLLGMIAGGIYLFIIAGMRMSKYAYIDKAPFELTEESLESAQLQRVAYRPDYSHNIGAGAALCVLSPAPVCAAAVMGLSRFFLMPCVGLLLAMIGAGVFVFVQNGMIMNSFTRILQEGEHAPERKRRRWSPGR